MDDNTPGAPPHPHDPTPRPVDDIARAVQTAELEPLTAQLRDHGWSRETTADPAGYDLGTRPTSYGQCAVTALLVQQTAGGQLMRVEVTDLDPSGTITTVSHYYNQLPDGTEVDLTRDQFTRWAPGTNVSDPQTRDRAYLLGHDGTRQRYTLLAAAAGLPFVETVPDAST